MRTESGRANRRILIVDDTASIHQDFRKILCADEHGAPSLDTLESALFGTTAPVRQAFDLDSAYQGQEALALVKKALDAHSPYAMVFIDMRMPPGWDGLHTIEQLWEADPNLQIALCTAYSDYSFEAIEARLKYNDQLLILKKPFDHLEIRQMASALTWKWQLAQDAALKVISLERTIEERVQELLKVSHLLQYDALTELPNSTLLGDRLTQAIALGRRHDTQLAVMFLGLDRFKRINNALGYPAGDEVLAQVSLSLVAAIRASDSVFRYGSDEFVVLLNDIQHPQQTQHIAQKVLNAVSATRHVAGHDLSVSASLGISIYPDDSDNAVGLLKHAETAMRTSKERGPGDFSFYTEDMNLRAQHQQNLESAIRQALDRDSERGNAWRKSAVSVPRCDARFYRCAQSSESVGRSFDEAALVGNVCRAIRRDRHPRPRSHADYWRQRRALGAELYRQPGAGRVRLGAGAA